MEKKEFIALQEELQTIVNNLADMPWKQSNPVMLIIQKIANRPKSNDAQDTKQPDAS
jgi:hypothetical protein